MDLLRYWTMLFHVLFLSPLVSAQLSLEHFAARLYCLSSCLLAGSRLRPRFLGSSLKCFLVAITTFSSPWINSSHEFYVKKADQILARRPP